MWQGKNKAITFSLDDGVLQDERAIQILDDYGLKCTFNLNSGWLGKSFIHHVDGIAIDHTKFTPDQVKEIYKNHEVAVHTLTHPNLVTETTEEIIRQVEEDRKALEALVGYDIVGMAYPGGCVDDRVANVLKEHTKIQYSRTVVSTYNFEPQTDLLQFNPTVYYIEWEKMIELAKQFLEMEAESDKIFYIWGHAYEMDAGNRIDWKKFEQLCKLISGKKDIFYGTNAQVLLGK